MGASPPRAATAEASPRAAAPSDASRAYFQYTGPTALTAVGAGTGTRYRFAHPGAIVAVVARDRRSLAAVPALRQVAAP
jgi:hypothetical protein